MDIAQFIQDFGYLAVALGSFIEGEAVLLAASLAAYHGHLDMALVFPIATLASFLGDLPYFFLGRRYGNAVFARYPSQQRRRLQLERFLQRHHVPLVLTLRFMYGFRIAGLIAIGASRLPTWRFLCLDFIGAVIWSSLVCATGFGVGRILQRLAGDLSGGEQAAMVGAVVIGASLLMLLARRRWLARLE